jgi:hypothetical protein
LILVLEQLSNLGLTLLDRLKIFFLPLKDLLQTLRQLLLKLFVNQLQSFKFLISSILKIFIGVDLG